MTTTDLTCRRCSLTLADHVLGGEPEDMEADGFNAADFAFEVPKGAWCLHGLGGHQEFFVRTPLRIVAEHDEVLLGRQPEVPLNPQ